MDYEEVLKHLCALPGPSGFESPVAQAAAELLRTLVDEVRVDRMGSVVGLRRCGKENAPRLLLDAHLDEIGFLITGHEDGYLRFAPLGGVDPRMLPDRELTILTQPPRLGVVACMPPHVQTAEDMNKPQPIKDLYIDVGLSQEEAERLIPVGTPAVYRAGCTRLGDKLLCGKSLDDRSCFAILLDALERLKGEKLDVDVYVLGSTQEETHSTGAITAAYGIVPELCVAVDVTHGDSPDGDKGKTFPLGGGPVIGRRPQLHPVDVTPSPAQGGGGRDGLPDRGDGRPLGHQRLAPTGEPGGRGHRCAVPAPALYAHPHRDGEPGGHGEHRRPAGRLHPGPGRGGAQL